MNPETGETGDQKLMNQPGGVEKFYRQFPAGWRIGVEATGNCQWFLELMAKLGQQVREKQEEKSKFRRKKTRLYSQKEK